jgi:hypothetical protein
LVIANKPAKLTPVCQTVYNLMFALFTASCASVLLTLAVINFAVNNIIMNQLKKGHKSLVKPS